MWCHWEGVGAWCGPLVNGPRMGRRGESQVSKTMTRRRVRTQKRLRGPWMDGKASADPQPSASLPCLAFISPSRRKVSSPWG